MVTTIHTPTERDSVDAYVMAHPQRQREAARIAQLIDPHCQVVLDDTPGGNPRLTATRCWEAPGDGSLKLVVQDDAVVSGDLVQSVLAHGKHLRTGVLALYANWNSRNGALCRIGAMRGYDWVAAAPTEYFPTVGILMPTQVGHEFAAWSRANAQLGREDDEAMAGFISWTGTPAFISVPNIVDHSDMPSIVGNGDSRMSAVFGESTVRDAAPAVLSTVPFLPRPRFGKVKISFAIDGFWREHVITDVVPPAMRLSVRESRWLDSILNDTARSDYYQSVARYTAILLLSSARVEDRCGRSDHAATAIDTIPGAVKFDLETGDETLARSIAWDTYRSWQGLEETDA